MTTDDRYQRGLDRMMELVSAEQSESFDHVKLVESYKTLDSHLSDYATERGLAPKSKTG